jgi:hypothetical protein
VSVAGSGLRQEPGWDRPVRARLGQPPVAGASVQSIEREIREFMGLRGWKISRGRCGLFLPGGFLVLYLRRLYAQLDRLTEARGNEVGFRAFP